MDKTHENRNFKVKQETTSKTQKHDKNVIKSNLKFETYRHSKV